MDLLARHEETLRATQRVVDGVEPPQLAKPTPCTEWDVRSLLGHIVGTNTMFARAARGEPPAEGDPGDPLGDDPPGAYRRSVEEAMEALHRPGVLEGTLKLPFGEMPAQFALGLHVVDNLVHRWDLATATGQDPGLDPETANFALEFCQTNFAALPPEQVRGPGKAFAAEVPWPEEGTAEERLVAFLGRHPHG
jgi:uncharacterized protein (TIGR03086 family)